MQLCNILPSVSATYMIPRMNAPFTWLKGNFLLAARVLFNFSVNILIKGDLNLYINIFLKELIIFKALFCCQACYQTFLWG